MSEFINLTTISNMSCGGEDSASRATYNGSTIFLVNLTDGLLVFYPWIMIVLGTTTNIISFVVFSKPKLKKSSTFSYLSCLCIIDLLTVYSFCLNFIFFYQFNIDIQLKHIVICKLYSFLTYFLPQFSAWTVAAVSFDRVIGVLFSVRGRYAAAAKRWNTPAKAYRVMCAIFLFIFFLNVHFLFYPNETLKFNDLGEGESYDIKPSDELNIADVNVIYCSPENIPRYYDFYSIWVHIDLLFNVLIPFAIMIASSIVIVVRLHKTTKNIRATGSTRSSMASTASGVGSSAAVKSMLKKTSQAEITGAEKSSTADILAAARSDSCASPPISPRSHSNSLAAPSACSQVRFKPSAAELSSIIAISQTNLSTANDGPPSARPRKSFLLAKRKSSAFNVTVSTKARSVSYMLATNNFVFISLTLPIVVFLSFTPPITLPTLCPFEKARLRLIKVICIILMNSNCAVNIFIYSFMSSEFRCALITLFKEIFCCSQPSVSSSSSAVNQSSKATRNRASKNSSGDFSEAAFIKRQSIIISKTT